MRVATIPTLPLIAPPRMPTESLVSIQERLVFQGAAPSHLHRIASVQRLCEASPYCVGLALVGSFAQGCGDRISDLDLAAFVDEGRETEFLNQAREFLGGDAVLNEFGHARQGAHAFRKYVYLDFSSCELYAFSSRLPFKLYPPFIAVWDPTEFLQTLVVNEAPPSHESFKPYLGGDEALIWELVDCIKWLRRGRNNLAKNYLANLGRAIDLEHGEGEQVSR